MKQFKFKNKATVIRGIKEERPKKKRNWDRIIYLLIFIIAFVSLFIYIVQANIYVFALGEVLTNRFDVQFPEDVQIIEYYYEEGDSIQRGDTLFYMKMNFDEGGYFGFGNAIIEKPNEWLLKERLMTLKNIQLKKIELEDRKIRVADTRKTIERLKLEVYLDVYTPEELNSSRQQLQNYLTDIASLETEIEYLYEYLNRLRDYKRDYDVYMGASSDIQTTSFYISPVNGLITKIFKPPHEITYSQEVAIYISNFDEMYIKAFIAQEDLDYYKTGEIVNLSFMDGTKSKGRIKEFYLNTEAVPEEFREVRGKAQRNVVAEIYPTSEADKLKWLPYYRFSVRVSKFKFF